MDDDADSLAGGTRLLLTTVIDAVLALAALAIMVAWFFGRPLFYAPAAPVTSWFTALSLLIMVSMRQARLRLAAWPETQTLALIGLVLGGNVASIVMIVTAPHELWRAFPNLVLTSIMTSIGLVLFCAHELVVTLRATPRSAFILDDLLIHLALVPGGLSLLGYLLGNPTYLSIHTDPRVGISLLEMSLMGLFATAAVVSNPRLFLWRFLASGWTNRAVFALLFLNQFAAPLAVALLMPRPGASGPGVELFVMLAGAVTTMSFLLFQAHLVRRRWVHEGESLG